LGRKEDAIASSDITKAPIVTCPTNIRKRDSAIDTQDKIGLRFNIRKEVKDTRAITTKNGKPFY